MKKKLVVFCSLSLTVACAAVVLIKSGSSAFPLELRSFSNSSAQIKERLEAPTSAVPAHVDEKLPSALPSLQNTIFKAGKHYAILPVPTPHKPQIIEFFSFYCVQCYRLQHEYHLSEALASSLPPDGQLKQYHVSAFGPLAKELSRAWAVAITLGVEKKLNLLLFDGIQKHRNLNTPEDIRQLFIDAGIAASTYDSALNSFVVNSLITQQEQVIQEAKIWGVPALLVNRKYRVHPENFSVRNGFPEFMSQYLQLVKQLVATVD
jgi:thiol:disulfide interchange protein DsbA